MRRPIDIETWYRKDQFEFFSQFDEPFFGITARIDCTTAYSISRERGHSFFLYYLHKSLVAANGVEPFRYRILGNQIYCYDVVNASPTINRDDGSFGFSYMEYSKSFQTFESSARKEIEKVRSEKGLKAAVTGENVIHYSSIPWIDFTSLSHARHFGFPDSCPKISFGKMTEEKGNKSMPVSVHVHHGLMDGFHVGQFLDAFQDLMNEHPES